MFTSHSTVIRRIVQLAIIVVVIISLFSYPSSQTIAAKRRIPTYTTTPAFTELNLNQSNAFAVSLVGGQANARYTFNVTVTKPDQVSISVAEYTVTTDGNGYETSSIPYPAEFHGSNSLPATDQVGTYEVRVDQTLPSYRYDVSTSSFMITSNLSVSILTPSTGTAIERGSNVTLSALVQDINGNSKSNVNVTAILPGPQGTIEIPESQQPGIYTTSYQVKWSDPSGPWNIDYRAADAFGNNGEVSVAANITSTTLSIQRLSCLGANGQSRFTFYNNETVNFQLEAEYPDGSSAASGAGSIGIFDPTGRLQVSLALIYDPQINTYRTLTGYQLNSTEILGTWTATIDTNDLSDSFGNKGPLTPASIGFSVTAAPAAYGNSQNPAQNSNALGNLPLMLGAFIVATIAPIAAFKRRGRSARKDDLDLLIEEGLAAKFTVIEGEKQTGKSTACYMIAGRSAKRGQKVILLSFENSPATVRTRMSQIGADSIALEESGDLEVIDCSDVSKSLNPGYVRSQVLDSVNDKAQRTTIIIDSLDLLYDDLEEREVHDLLMDLRNETQSLNGVLYATITHDSIPSKLLLNLESNAGMVIQAEKSPVQGNPPTILRIKKIANNRNKMLGDYITLEGLAQNPTNDTRQLGKML